MIDLTRRILALPFLALVLALFLAAPEISAAPDALAIGDTLPEVSLTTADNKPFALRAAAASKPAVLVFFRGGWCPYCNRHLGALAEIEDDLAALGVQLLAISPDSPEKLYAAPKREEQPKFTLLSDQDARAMDAFGISFVVPDELVAKYKTAYMIDIEADSGRTHHKLPHPAVYVVDTTGVIRFAHVNEDYRVRLEPTAILEAVKASRMP